MLDVTLTCLQAFNGLIFQLLHRPILSFVDFAPSMASKLFCHTASIVIKFLYFMYFKPEIPRQ